MMRSKTRDRSVFLGQSRESRGVSAAIPRIAADRGSLRGQRHQTNIAVLYRFVGCALGVTGQQMAEQGTQAW